MAHTTVIRRPVVSTQQARLHVPVTMAIQEVAQHALVSTENSMHVHVCILHTKCITSHLIAVDLCFSCKCDCSNAN